MKTILKSTPLVLMVIFAGCASHRSVILKPSSGKTLSEFKTLEVPTFKSLVRGDFPPTLLGELPDKFIKEVEEKKLFIRVTRDRSEDPNTLVMDCKIISYDKGNRAKRALWVVGSGKAFCTVQCDLIDKSSGAAFSSVNFEGELTAGFFGGSASKNTSKGVSKAMVKYLQQNF